MPEKPWLLTLGECNVLLDMQWGVGEYSTETQDLANIIARAAQRKLVQWLEPQLGSDYHNLATYVTLETSVWQALCTELGIDA